MSRKYLIDAEEMFSFQIENKKYAKEVEVLDEKRIKRIEDKYLDDGFISLSDYLAANNLQIIKTVK